jgi:ABC-type bacteriocin/lantibiotic exporter with double-glycine peptidase domain
MRLAVIAIGVALCLGASGRAGEAPAAWLDVPFIQQEKNGCGAAAVWMVMRYWRPQHGDGEADLREIKQQLYSKDAGGIFGSDLEGFLRKSGFRTFIFAGDMGDLQQHISKGRPLIVAIASERRAAPLHYLVVAGHDAAEDIVLVNDPAQRKLLKLSRREFESRWKASNNWTLLALPLQGG